jgi:P27 family predicted phage terminase small subunit
LKVIHGGKYKEAELRAKVPKPRRVLPRCPDYLTGEAEACWKRTAKELYDAGLLTSVDRDALALYCQAFARWRETENALAKSTVIIRTNVKRDEETGEIVGGGNWIQNPLLAIANKAFEQMSKLQAEFGMTPSSRTRVSIAKPDAQRAAKAAVSMGETTEVEDVLKALAG